SASSPPAAPQIVIAGDYTQTADGVLEIEVGGTNAADFTSLVVSNRVNLDGTLNVRIANGLTLPANSSFSFLSSSSTSNITGKFTNVTVSGSGSAVALNMVGTNLTLQVLNNPPVISAIPDHNLSRSSILNLAVVARDNDLPVQTLQFGLKGPP